MARRPIRGFDCLQELLILNGDCISGNFTDIVANSDDCEYSATAEPLAKGRQVSVVLHVEHTSEGCSSSSGR